jgi:hypothetical protein
LNTFIKFNTSPPRGGKGGIEIQNKNKKRGDVWNSRRLAFTLRIKSPQGHKEEKNEAVCGIHTASSFTPRKQALGGIKKEKKKRKEAACGIHAASSSTPWIKALAGIKEG